MDSLGQEKTALEVAAVLDLGDEQTKKFLKNYKIDVAASLRKDLEKADNRMLTNIMMAVFMVFALVYFWVEKVRNPTAARMQNMFKKLQLISSAAFSLGHGGSDAQKVMGIIGAAMIANGDIIDFKEIPNWVPLSCYAAIALGTLSGGWKIVKTMGTRITKVTPLEGVGAETAGAITLFLTAQMGIPVSTTHTITGSIIGVGATKRLSAVRWGVTRSLLFAWIVTIPVSALVAGLIYLLVR
jgi:PiT family inorganic phosphate transporter